MRPLIRSLFLLSLTAAPVVLAANPSPVASAGVVAATSTAAVPVQPQSEELDQVEADVRELEATFDSLRREVTLIQEQDDARTLLIGDPDVHPLWP